MFTTLAMATLLTADLEQAVTFQATFDNGTDARIARGDKAIYTASSYKEQAAAKPGLAGAPVELVPGAGRRGGALRFTRKNEAAVFYRAQGNVAFDPKNWTGTISFWLKLDPETELAPGFCDPIQVTDKAYNDSAIWVDFTKDEKPRHFRLGVFGSLKAWNPQNLEPDKNPGFTDRLVIVKKAPFGRDKWTNVLITHRGLGSGSGEAALYLDGVRQGSTPAIREVFEWDWKNAAIRVGVNYVGLFDELTIYNRVLTAEEIRTVASGK